MDVALLDIRTRAEFRRWLERNARSERECWVRCKRGAVPPDDRLAKLIAASERGEMIGAWNDYGRLLE